jgi:hypothetical protein
MGQREKGMQVTGQSPKQEPSVALGLGNPAV